MEVPGGRFHSFKATQKKPKAAGSESAAFGWKETLKPCGGVNVSPDLERGFDYRSKSARNEKNYLVVATRLMASAGRPFSGMKVAARIG
jgi:hypothetical protein